ncbi:ATPase [Planococcus antarcticus DSM 14505]|uniref:histidine kinase n=1 Tax=Planococcus antarcticus DSM 14505 TaxID=1185653 RepID=A0ABN4RCN8_9BACL|nr:sensor histidine kinase [Planococcus antarcticus]ANU09801.1 ATPase [Planococcus antarcticus DSM 14505]
MRNLSLQTKIILLNMSLILFVTAVFGGIVTYNEIGDTKGNVGTRALETAIGISITPSIVEAMNDENPEAVIQPLAEYMRKQVGAEFIVVGNLEGIRYSHPDPTQIGKRMVGGDNDRALANAEFYTSEARGSLGPSLRGKAPIFDGNGNVVGLVSVGYLLDDIQEIIVGNVLEMLQFVLLVLAIGIIGSILLAKNIRKETMGLEPREIAAMYRDREALLSSIVEGVIAIDHRGKITEINQSAEKMIGLTQASINSDIADVIPQSKMTEALQSEKTIRNEEMLVGNKLLIINRTQITHEGQVVGVVSTFREKTDIQEVLETLSEIQQYSEGLRAQTHEYSNKLYAISGLLQLGQKNEAIDLIQRETRIHENQTKHMLDHIQDKKVQAILLGKMGKASENKVNLIIDENSSLEVLPKHFDIAKLIHILGNLIDNAIEEVAQQSKREVSFFVTDLGRDLVIEVEDTGRGIREEYMKDLFNLGFSTKLGKKDRGYGLAIVQQAVEELKGTIEVDSELDRGTVFTVFLPK